MNRRPVIGLSGAKRAGKDTVAQYLVKEYGFTQVAFADPLRKYLLKLNPIVEERVDSQTVIHWRLSDFIQQHGWEYAKDRSPDVRGLLQRLGTEVIRDIHSTAWIELAKRTIDEITGPVVISDMRFWNEAVFVAEVLGGRTVLVKRPGTDSDDDHASEQDLKVWDFSVILYNDSDIAGLHARIDGLARTGAIL